jgi:8-amino-7-oxononanoate synthase
MLAFEQDLVEALQQLEDAELRRLPKRVDSLQGPTVEIEGRSVLCLCSNNYLGLANHPALVEAAMEAAQTEGTGSGASRLITGTMTAHDEAESAFAAFVGRPTAALFSTGYATNLGTIQALLGREDIVFSDALNHASLIDGCRLSRATIQIYRHCDATHLEELLRQHRSRARRALIVSDSLFSMDGDLAPVADLAELARRYDAGLLVDEAHALGVLGPSGRGVCAAVGVVPDLIVGTLGKSFGVAGAFVAGSEPVISLIQNRARSFVYSTAPSPILVRAALAALPLVQRADQARERLLEHAGRLRRGLRALGLEVPAGTSQILPVRIGDNARTMRISQQLFDQGIFVQGIRPPTVPVGTARLRLTPMATHEPEQIDRALLAFAEVLEQQREDET